MKTISFTAPMAGAAMGLDGPVKTQTRRLFFALVGSTPVYGPGFPKGAMPWQGETTVDGLSPLQGGPAWPTYALAKSHDAWRRVPCPYGKPGDRLAVLEPLRKAGPDKHWATYAANGADVLRHGDPQPVPWIWKPSGLPGRYMPRELVRSHILIKGVRFQRLHDITEADIIAEGVTPERVADLVKGVHLRKLAVETSDLMDLWRHGWDAINGERCPWSCNPWLWVLDFERIDLAQERAGLTVVHGPPDSGPASGVG